MSKSDFYENALLALAFNATTISSFALASTGITQLWASLHTADVGESGTQGTNEANYAGYARVAVARSTAGFVVSGNVVSPVSVITFPTATSTSTGTITHGAFGLSSASTAGNVLYKGAVSPNQNYGQGVAIQLTTSSSVTED